MSVPPFSQGGDTIRGGMDRSPPILNVKHVDMFQVPALLARSARASKGLGSLAVTFRHTHFTDDAALYYSDTTLCQRPQTSVMVSSPTAVVAAIFVDLTKR